MHFNDNNTLFGHVNTRIYRFVRRGRYNNERGDSRKTEGG